MGLRDLFSSEKGEKDELQENIEKIRQKVQEEKGGRARQEREPEPGQESRGGEGLRGGDFQSEDFDPSQDTAGGMREPPERPDRTRQEEIDERQVPESRQPRAGEEPERMEESSLDVERPGGTGSGAPSREELPEPPEKRELDIPDIEKGPLFINVEKFRDALMTLAELRDLASDLESYTGSMEGTLEEDRGVQQSMQKALDELEQDSRDLEDIVSP